MNPTEVTQENWIAALEKRSERLENPIHQTMVRTLIDYLRAGPLFDVVPFMATLTDDVVFRRFGVQNGTANVEKIRKHYLQAVDAGIWPQYHLDMERLCFSDDAMAFDGVFRAFATRKDILAHGHVKADMVPEGGSDQDAFLVSRRLATFLTYRDGKIAIEDSYWDPATIELI